ncbi:hypothetical protein jhhlp_005680 [Lomentospora prolificans]|uniref:Tetrapyrrole biosynthesis uroporphyrinogen III synthase domain-containing protein n=1 Tax=Lomentospora prolificans TaxID=41688 RepID=A0A2N3N3T0_9PEZI|nr:hypothetical protein jhhlp_005680 [Lomentospora prolificans]
MTSRVPVLFLKTKSAPSDAYEDLFSKQPLPQCVFEPQFVPVLRHSFKENGMAEARTALQNRQVNETTEAKYGGMIFTSQRAVEAFTALVEDGKGDPKWPHLQRVPVYSVGPATTRALRAVPQEPPLQVFGDHTGNGETLAPFILDHYREWYKGRSTLPPLLFLVGEQRRDVIPRKLMDENLPSDRRIEVREVEMYETREMESFPVDLRNVLRGLDPESTTWVVVFSPAGCETMLKGIGFLDSDGNAKSNNEPQSSILVATIGPTTRDCLKGFGFSPHACAEQPSPEGILKAIDQYRAGIN